MCICLASELLMYRVATRVHGSGATVATALMPHQTRDVKNSEFTLNFHKNMNLYKSGFYRGFQHKSGNPNEPFSSRQYIS